MPTANAPGRICAWAFPFDSNTVTTTSFITAADHIYPFMDEDLVSIYTTNFVSSTWPGSAHYAGLNLVASANWNLQSNTANTVLPMHQRKLRVGAFYTYTITNSGNFPIFVTPYKIYSRRDLDKSSYHDNIILEYIDHLWQSGIGTSVSGTLDEDTMFNYVHSNKYDFFDAHTFLSTWNVKSKRPFTLAPGKSRTFSIRLKARTWHMRDWFNDFGAITTAECPWARLKGVPEYVFKYTTGDGGFNTMNYWPTDAKSHLPDLTGLDIQPVGICALSYNIKYYVKHFPFLQARTYSTIASIGMGAGNPTAARQVVDDDYTAQVAVAV